MMSFSIIHLLIIGPIFLAIGLLPTILALAFRRSNWPLILLVNFFLGWTGIGWLVCLLWAALGWGDKAVKAV
jgi:hypothetical protein